MNNKLVEMDAFSSKLWYNNRSILKSGLVSLYLQVVINGKHKEFPLKLQWPPGKINLVKNVLLPRHENDPDVSDYNLMIMMEQAKHTEIFKDYRIRKVPLDVTLFAQVVSVHDQKESFVAYMKRTILMRSNSKDIAHRTVQNHNATVVHMMEFNGIWPFERINAAWMKKFKNNLANKLIKKGKVFGKPEPGQIWTTVKTVKAYLQIALLDPLIEVDKAAANFPNPQPDWKTKYLSKNELKRLLALLNYRDLTVNQKKVLEAFLFQCFTSLRISDVYRANSKWGVTDNFLDFIPKKNSKNGRWIHVPIMPLAYTLIKNTAGQYFDLPNQGEYNEILKKLAEFADIKKVLTSHVGRHTFGYLYMTTVGNLKGLQEIMGHKDIKTTMRYAHLDDEYKTESVKMIQDKFTNSLMNAV
jgi:integrase/recombinase XerD